MQYKIPVQIENEDKIIGPFSIRQLIILLFGGAIWYMIFKWLAPSLWAEIAAIPWIIIVVFTLVIVLFKHSWMTFVPFILNLIRLNVIWWNKLWQKWVDSFTALDIWYVVLNNKQENKKVDLENKKQKLNELKDKLNKL